MTYTGHKRQTQRARTLTVEKLPAQRRKALAFIQAEVSKGRPFPTRRQLCIHMGWKQDGSASDVMANLFYDGFLVREMVGIGHGRVKAVYSLPPDLLLREMA